MGCYCAPSSSVREPLLSFVASDFPGRLLAFGWSLRQSPAPRGYQKNVKSTSQRVVAILMVSRGFGPEPYAT